jgi:GNAT superfamily N-acetyltransferase
MKIAAPLIRIRKPDYGEMLDCCRLARINWGEEAADRCREQFIEYFKGGKYNPIFVVACNDRGTVIGFAAYRRSMLMKGAFELIWLAVDEKYQGCDIGRQLTEWRLFEIEASEGQMILLMTQKPDYFSKFGFFKLHHTGNEWYLMLKLLKATDI